MSSLAFALLVPGPPRHRATAVRDRVADGLAIVLALAYGAVMVRLGDATAAGAAIPWPADVAIGVLCAGALTVRRRWPLGTALALLPFGAVSVAATGPILAALFTAAIRRRAVAMLPLGLAHVGTGVVYFLLQADPPYPLSVDIVLRVLTALVAVGWGQFLRAYRRLERTLRERADRLIAEQQLRLEQARLTERERIAREMHDVLAHRMSMVSLHAGALEVRTDAQPEEIAAAAATIRTSAHQALQELRAVLGTLRDSGPPEPPQPGLEDLEGLIDDARTSGMQVDWVWLGSRAQPDPMVGRTVYRIVQEALTNAHKHAPRSNVDIVVNAAAGRDVHVQIVNPLHRRDPETTGTAEPDPLPGAGSGLIGIDERVSLAGGRVQYGPDDDRFRLEAWLPWTK